MTPIPSFIYKKKNQITMVLFVPLFALLFILIYKPLDFDAAKTGRSVPIPSFAER